MAEESGRLPAEKAEAGYSPMRAYLERGSLLLAETPEALVEAAPAAWKLLRKAILDDWLKTKPGTRPWAWWKWEAPERRRRIGSWLKTYPAGVDRSSAVPSFRFVADKRPHPFSNPERVAMIERDRKRDPSMAYLKDVNELAFGVPRYHLGGIADDFWPAYEEEVEYLERLGLLTKNERQALAAKGD